MKRGQKMQYIDTKPIGAPIRSFGKIDWNAIVWRVIAGVVTAAIVWMVVTISAVDKTVARMEPRLGAIEVQMSSVYRADMASRDMREMDKRLDVHDVRLNGVEARMTAIEAKRQ